MAAGLPDNLQKSVLVRPIDADRSPADRDLLSLAFRTISSTPQRQGMNACLSCCPFTFRQQPAWQPLFGAKPSTQVQTLRLPTYVNLLTALCAISLLTNRLPPRVFRLLSLMSLNDAFAAQSICVERNIAAELVCDSCHTTLSHAGSHVLFSISDCTPSCNSLRCRLFSWPA